MDQYNIELALAAAISASELSVMDSQAALAQSNYLLMWVMDEWCMNAIYDLVQ